MGDVDEQTCPRLRCPQRRHLLFLLVIPLVLSWLCVSWKPFRESGSILKNRLRTHAQFRGASALAPFEKYCAAINRHCFPCILTASISSLSSSGVHIRVRKSRSETYSRRCESSCLAPDALQGAAAWVALGARRPVGLAGADAKSTDSRSSVAFMEALKISSHGCLIRHIACSISAWSLLARR